MKLYEIYSDLSPKRRTGVFGIRPHSNYDYRLGPPPQTDIERKLGKMEREIRRDQTERDIDVPIHMRNEYFDIWLGHPYFLTNEPTKRRDGCPINPRCRSLCFS